MVIGLGVYLAGRRHLTPESARGAKAVTLAARSGLMRAEMGRLALLVVLIPVLTLSVVGNQQFYNAFPLWSQKHMDLLLFGWQVPVSWLQAVDAFMSTATMVVSIAFWRGWAARRPEPDELMKMALGSLVAAAAPTLLVIASWQIDASQEKVSFAWTLDNTFVGWLAGFLETMPVDDVAPQPRG